MAFPGAAARYSMILDTESGSCVELANLVWMSSNGRAAYWGLYRVFLERETRIKESLNVSRSTRDFNCERKHLPTPPVPVIC